MDKKSLIKYGVLIAIVAALSMVLFFIKNYDPQKLPDIAEIKSLEKIVIEKGNGETMELKKDGENWFIMPEEYKVSDRVQNRMISAYEDIVLKDVIEKKVQRPQEYQLDEEGRTKVSLYDGDKKALELYVGKVSYTYKHTYVRLDEDGPVYHAQGKLADLLEEPKKQMISKVLTAFSPDQIVRVEIEEDGKTFEIRKNISFSMDEEEATGAKDKWTLSWSKERANTQQVDKFINALSSLRAKSIYDGDPENAQSYMRKISAHTDSDIIDIYIIAADKDGNHICKASDRNAMFVIPKGKGDQVLSSTFGAPME